MWYTNNIQPESFSELSFSPPKRGIIEADWKICQTEASSHQSTSLAAKIATGTTWSKLLDMAVVHGKRGIQSLCKL